jgi:hypothetical protein
MPFALALVASALLHAAALVGSGWTLPGTHEPELPQTIEAVLAKPPVRSEPAPEAKPAPRPPVARPRPATAAQPVLAADKSAPAVPVEPPPVAEPAPVAVAPAPSARDTVSGSAGDITPEPPEPAAPVPAKTALPGKGSLRYVITRGEGGFVIGQAIHSWEHDGFRYRLKSLTETTGLAAVFKPAQVFQSSQGDVTEDGLRPREFRHERSGSTDTASFDWLARVVTYAGRRQSVVGGTQDMLSMYYQLVLLAPLAGTLEMPIATGRKLENYRIEVLGEEVLALKSGERRVLHVRTRSGDDSIDIWLGLGPGAAARGLPLKIRFIDRKGEIFDQIADEPEAAQTQ